MARNEVVRVGSSRRPLGSLALDMQTLCGYEMRRTFRYDPDLDAVVEVGNYFEEKPQSGPNVIGDDVGAGVNGLMNFPSGKMLDSKSRHRAENRARGAEEVGNETNFASEKYRPHP